MRKILMPQGGKSGGPLTLVTWCKAEGAAVSAGEVLARAECLDGVVEMTCAEAGVLRRILLPAGKTAAAGAVIAEMGDASPAAEVHRSSDGDELTRGIRREAKAEKIAMSESKVVPVLMPQAGNSMEEGTIVKWMAKEGDRIEKGQVIFEIETDKANMEVEATDAGRLAKIVAAEGAVVPVKQAVAYLAESDADLVGMVAERHEGTEARRDEGEEKKSEEAKDAVDAIPVLMPQAGNSMEEGTIIRWMVKEGDRIEKGQAIFEIETDKANMEVEATDAGRVAKIIADVGAVVPVKQPVAYLAEGDIDIARLGATEAQSTQSAQSAQSTARAVTPVAVSSVLSAPSVSSGSGTLKASPAAKKIAREKGIDLAAVGMGSGPGGRILSTDLTNVSGSPATAAKPAAAPAKETPTVTPVATLSAGQVVRKKMTKMRKAIAANLQMSKQTVPHFYLRGTINADAMMSFYRGEKAKYPCSVNDVVTLACAKAIIEFPAFRSRIEKDEIVEYPSVNIGVAVGVEDGLTVPVILNAHTMDLQQIAAQTKRIVENARNGKLEGYGQGNFTITNLGMFGVEEFAAIVNPPEPGILAVGAVREAVIVKDGFMKPGKVMTMTLSCDHRLVDGLLAAKFMARLKELLETPAVMA